MTVEHPQNIFLETSSYLPLIWRTPYSQAVVESLIKHRETRRFFLQRDCIREAAAYLSFEDNWRYHPGIRIRILARRLSDEQLARLPFPSTAIQVLLGGNIWPQAQYLNFVRHTTFFFVDLVDGISFTPPRNGLLELADRIDRRLVFMRNLFSEHLEARILQLPIDKMLSYWGTWYLMEVPPPFAIHILEDPRPYDKTSDKLRDIFHYDCIVAVNPKPAAMLVANTGFTRNAKTSFANLPIPIICAETQSKEFFGEG